MITFHLTIWWVPTLVTLALLVPVVLIAWAERNESGMLSGLGAAVALIAFLVATVAVWAVFLLTHYIK